MDLWSLGSGGQLRALGFRSFSSAGLDLNSFSIFSICQVYHDPEAVTAAIVTCGGLCPGLNNVIQGIVNTLEDYGKRSTCFCVTHQLCLDQSSLRLHASKPTWRLC